MTLHNELNVVEEQEKTEDHGAKDVEDPIEHVPLTYGMHEEKGQG